MSEGLYLHASEQVGSNEPRFQPNLRDLNGTPMPEPEEREVLGSLRLHVGYGRYSNWPAEPKSLSDDELATFVTRLTAQRDRLETEKRDGIAFERERHAALQSATPELVGRFMEALREARESLAHLGLVVELEKLTTRLDENAAMFAVRSFNSRSLSDYYPGAPRSLDLAIDALKAEVRRREFAKAARRAELQALLHEAGVAL